MMGYMEIALRILLAIGLGGVIGMERQFKHRPAGFKTHILVCVGSATIMVLSEYMFRKYHAEFGMLSDPARLGAQVISGVGFLGAGTIIHHGPNVRGLTTAASLWVVAAIGLACGAGFYFLAIIVTVNICLILFIFNKIYKGLRYVSEVTNLSVESMNKPKVIGAINLLLASHNIKILDMEFINMTAQAGGSVEEAEVVYLNLMLKLTPEVSVYTLIQELERINGVIKVEHI
ncbi:MAG: MgtC/SapB family protein [Lachnospiraceae bacterium]